MRPNSDDNVSEDGEQKHIHDRALKPSSTSRAQFNRTLTNKDSKTIERIDNVPSLRLYNTQLQNEKGRPNQVIIGNKQSSSNFPPSQKPAARRMILTSEIQKADPGFDEIKAGSNQKTQYIQAPGHIARTTTESAIPIIRLSNEMDLDGSFSYEALGADQTHYVQHSRMENMGTDKEEQVVEGSYSYIGDDGRTYTVHYIADSNGYRASGDHLPSPPPVPEIIQRAIQYNLAEEARRPPHLRNIWENEGSTDESKEESKQNFFSIPQQRSLFTGRTPEAFSFSDSSNSQSNQITSRSNFNTQTKPKNENILHNELKLNTPITPQITFLASQGAHSPLSQQQTQPTVQKASYSDKLPQLINYEADKEVEREANKQLWRWQYGYNANENPNKNSISRSFTEGDDVIINFSDMTPEQYTRMMQTEILTQTDAKSNNIENDNTKHYPSSNFDSNSENNINERNTFSGSQIYNIKSETDLNNNDRRGETRSSTPIYETLYTTALYRQESNKYNNEQNSNLHTNIPVAKTEYQHKKSEVFEVHDFSPENQLVTQSFNSVNTPFEAVKINKSNENSTVYKNFEQKYEVPTLHNEGFSQDQHNHMSTPSSNLYTNIYVTPYNYYQYTEQNSFKPSINENKPETFTQQSTTTTTESSVEQMIQENIFLRNLFKTNTKNTSTTELPRNEDSNIYKFNNPEPFNKPNNVVENKQNLPDKPKPTKDKSLNLNEIFNYVMAKNHFESSKTKPKSKSTHYIQYNNNLNKKENPVMYIPIIKENNKNEEESFKEENKNHSNLNQQQQQELHGLIKNYKVLQRQKNAGSKSQIMYEPQLHIKTFHSPGLPPLGRAGPSMKTYFPPTLQR
ncbi:unnamed protein product [Danaus chrysippus]|uniref:(African queen) hypothetical protein n=1 Tax=Danaus chrysippus TaxID=151541 RepID=A0A8J2VSI1_9NEOP|nr:unnamed protein product [Danaus chrysippus]